METPLSALNGSLEQLRAFAGSALGQAPSRVEALSGGGSNRRYYRLWVGGGTVIGAISDNAAELRAFLAFTRHFAAKGIPVPAIPAADQPRGLYLMEDLGPRTLRDHLAALRGNGGPGPSGLAALEQAVRWLPVIQVRGGEGLDYAACILDQEMGRKTYAADIRLFREHFVARYAPDAEPDPAAIRQLEGLAERAAGLDATHFCYRDFQTRNIMWHEERPVFIDYQSGRRGPLVYDLASILYSPDSALDEPGRERLITAYLDALKGCGVSRERDAFLAELYPMVLLRRIQALGAYARLAAVKGKTGFLAHIPATMSTLNALGASGRIWKDCPDLRDWLQRVFELAARAAL